MIKLFVKFYTIITLGFITAQLLMSVLLNDLIEKEIVKDVLTTSKGVSNLIKHQFEERPQEEWPLILELLKPQFGYDLSLDSVSELSLSDSMTQQLQVLGRAVVVETPIIGSTPVQVLTLLTPNKVVVQHIRGNLESSLPLQIIPIIMWLSSIAIFVFLLTYPLYKRLFGLSIIAKKMSQGQFDVSFAPFEKGETAQLAKTFQHLVTRIDTLLDNQKLFLRLVAHEFRTPLTRIHFALEEIKNVENTEKIAHMYNDLDELNDMLNELGYYVKINDELANKHCGEVHDTRAVFTQQIATMNKACPELDFYFEWDGPDTICANKNLIIYCVRNILSNAVRFAHAHIKINVSNNTDGLVVKIIDDGQGVCESALAQLGTAFFSHNNKGGLGLGLSIVVNIINKLNGKIYFKHAHPSGLEVELFIPSSSNDFSI